MLNLKLAALSRGFASKSETFFNSIPSFYYFFLVCCWFFSGFKRQDRKSWGFFLFWRKDEIFIKKIRTQNVTKRPHVFDSSNFLEEGLTPAPTKMTTGVCSGTHLFFFKAMKVVKNLSGVKDLCWKLKKWKKKSFPLKKEKKLIFRIFMELEILSCYSSHVFFVFLNQSN